jgi:membrane protein
VKAKSLWQVLKETAKDWSEDKAARLAAALAYYTIFSLAPLLIIIIGIAGLVFGRQAVQGQLVGQIQGVVGQQGAQLIQTMIQGASKPSSGIIATVIGAVTLLVGAMGVFGQLQDSLNTIWEVKPRPGRGFLAVVKDRLASFLMVLGIGLLLVVSLVISAAVSAFGQEAGRLLGSSAVAQVLNFLVPFLVITLLFAMIFKVLPDVEISWREVWVGAAVTALLFSVGRILLGLYLGRAGTTSAYGAAGSLVIVLLWIYYSAQILFFGAEFTQVYARRYDRQIEPSANAVRVSAAERANQGMEGSKTQDTKGSATETQTGRWQSRPVREAVASQEPARRTRLYGPALAGVVLGLLVGFAGERRDDHTECP